VRFLVDECLPVRSTQFLKAFGHDSVHVADLDLLGASDDQVMQVAAAEGRILLSADTDFGELLAIGQHLAPSFVLLRGLTGAPDHRLRLLADNLDQVEDDLLAGAIVVFTEDRIRIRRLPVARPDRHAQDNQGRSSRATG
jgi:predicted nuclease of predicted toxin-antitoxin system